MSLIPYASFFYINRGTYAVRVVDVRTRLVKWRLRIDENILRASSFIVDMNIEQWRANVGSLM